MKLTRLLFLLLTPAASFAQQTLDFEDLTLPPYSHWNGSDETGGFTSGGVWFFNFYDTSWGGFWTEGFAYSNQDDTALTGTSGQYDSYAGGASSGTIFAVATPNAVMGGNPIIHFGGDPYSVSTLSVTNSSYAANSMRLGDAFGKQFGSPDDANGQPDGTNGEDWFRLTIHGLDSDSSRLDSVVVYLADYRFSDSSLDYILDDWEQVDLSSLGAVHGLEFELASSDMGLWGMNTPAFFLLDDLVWTLVGLEENKRACLSFYPNPTTSEVWLNAETSGGVRILDLSGKLLIHTQVVKGKNALDVSGLSSGHYLIELNGKVARLVIR